jgi:hypothetical protein
VLAEDRFFPAAGHLISKPRPLLFLKTPSAFARETPGASRSPFGMERFQKRGCLKLALSHGEAAAKPILCKTVANNASV